jgi:hypothetical protein
MGSLLRVPMLHCQTAVQLEEIESIKLDCLPSAISLLVNARSIVVQRAWNPKFVEVIHRL